VVHRCYPLDHAERLAYLHAEAQCLLEHHRELREEFTRLINAPFDREVWTDYRHKLHFYYGLLANHVLALKWLRHPPHTTPVAFVGPRCSGISGQSQ
jgi:hypothetical protein